MTRNIYFHLHTGKNGNWLYICKSGRYTVFYKALFTLTDEKVFTWSMVLCTGNNKPCIKSDSFGGVDIYLTLYK